MTYAQHLLKAKAEGFKPMTKDQFWSIIKAII